jgi:uncharacterized caspase-like protein
MSRLVLSVIALALGLLSASMWAGPAFADRRVALIIGNSAYQNAPALPNPVRDAQAITDMFRKAGFDVVTALNDVGIVQFRRALRQFEDQAADSDIAVIYYAGHGIEIHGSNYLIPIDAKLASDRDADDEAITLDRLGESVDGAKRLRLIILDACRDNPFAPNMKLQRTASIRGISSGLGAVEVTGINTLVAYAAKAGTSAFDGDSQHSPFTGALLDNLFVPGLDVRLAFGRVRDEVLKKTNNQQEPFVYGSLGGANIAIVPAPVQTATSQPEASAASADAGVKSDYSLVEKIGTKGAWEVFLNQHPTGFYSDLARQQISKLTLASAEVPQTPKSPPGPSTEEQRAWDKIKDSSNEDDFKAFIQRFPSSPLANQAKLHVDAIEQAAQQARAEAQRAEADRQAALAEAKRQADLKAQQAADLARAQQQAKAAQEAQEQAERDAASKQAALAAKQKAEADAAQQAALAKAQQEAAAAEQARLEAARQAQAQQEAACKTEQDRLDALQAEGAKARDDLKQLQQGLACERLRPLVTAALDQANALPDVDTPDQIRTAQRELTRLGCFSGSIDGKLTPPTTAAIQLYYKEFGKPTDNADVSDGFIADLKNQSGRVCPLVCPNGQVASGEQCVVAGKPVPVARAKDEEEEKTPPKPKQEVTAPAPRRKPEPTVAASRPAPARPAAAPAPRVIQQATTYSGGGGGGHAGTTIGVGF